MEYLWTMNSNLKNSESNTCNLKNSAKFRQSIRSDFNFPDKSTKKQNIFKENQSNNYLTPFFEQDHPSNVTISTNAPIKRKHAKKTKQSNQNPTQKKKLKKFEIEDIYNQKHTNHSVSLPFSRNFSSFNNSLNKNKKLDSLKLAEPNTLGKRGEMNPFNDIMKVKSYDTNSNDYLSHISSLKKCKMSESIKPKENYPAEFSEGNQSLMMNQSNVLSNFDSFKGINSFSNLDEKNLQTRVKKVRYSTGGRATMNKSASKKNDFKTNLPILSISKNKEGQDKTNGPLSLLTENMFENTVNSTQVLSNKTCPKYNGFNSLFDETKNEKDPKK